MKTFLLVTLGLITGAMGAYLALWVWLVRRFTKGR